MRKLLSVILALAMVLSVFTPVFAKDKDGDDSAPAPAAEKHIEFLKEQGIIQGDKSGDLMLDKNIDRASFAAILVRADGKEATAQSVKTLPGRFTDMDANHWGNGYATVAHDNGWMKGNPAGEFMPGKEISYAEIATTLVRFLGKEKVGFVYPTSYIAAATELGLFEGVELGGEYVANAKRDHVFHMLYNALSKEDFGKYNVYKVIMLENDRVAQLGDTELNAEVLSVVQMANNVDERGVAKVGQKMVIDVKDVKVEGGLADTENLIGKVANITLDENNKLVKIVVDTENYEYYWGRFDASKDGKTFRISGKKFNVRFDERYYRAEENWNATAGRRFERDDRVYRTYVTKGPRAENYNYITFAERVNLPTTHRDYLAANFARITVKDGMVLFVDTYCYTDIAPVESVGRGGGSKDVYFWNDVRNGAVERMTPARRVIGYTEKDGFKKIKAEDIKADDTIHWFDGFTLSRQDAVLEGKLVKTFIDNAGEWAVVKVAEDKERTLYLNSSKNAKMPFQSVFAYDNTHYRRLDGRQQLKDMVGSDVKILLDVFGRIQLITSHEKFTDRLGLVNKNVSAKGMEFFAPNAPEEARYRLNDGWDSNYYRMGKMNAQQTNRFDEFKKLDLVYTSADKDGDAKLVATIDGFEFRNGEYEGHQWRYASFNYDRDYLVLEGNPDDEYRYSDETDVFVINNNKNGVFEKVTLEDVKKYNKGNADLQAVVLTEKAYAEFLGKLRFETWGRYNKINPKFARAIIFTNYKEPQADLGKIEIGRIARIDNWSNVVEIEVDRDRFEEFRIHEDSHVDMKTVGEVNDYVEFRRVAGSDKDGKMLEARFDNIVFANIMGRVNSRDRYSIEIEGRIYNINDNTKEFGDSRFNYVKAYTRDINNDYRDKFIDLIVYIDTPNSVLHKDDAENYAKFKLALAAANTTPVVEANVRTLYNAYENLSYVARDILVTKEEKATYEMLLKMFPGFAMQEDYNEAVEELLAFNFVDETQPTDKEVARAKALIKKVKDLAAKKGITPIPAAAIKIGELEAVVEAYNKSKDLETVKRKRANAAKNLERDLNTFKRQYPEADQTEVERIQTAINELKAPLTEAEFTTKEEALKDIAVAVAQIEGMINMLRAAQ